MFQRGVNTVCSNTVLTLKQEAWSGGLTARRDMLTVHVRGPCARPDRRGPEPSHRIAGRAGSLVGGRVWAWVWVGRSGLRLVFESV